MESLMSCTAISDAHNAIFDAHTLNVFMINATLRDSSVGGCANAAKRARGNASPSDIWCASMLKRTDTDKHYKKFKNMMQGQIKTMRNHGRISKDNMIIAPSRRVDFTGATVLHC